VITTVPSAGLAARRLAATSFVESVEGSDMRFSPNFNGCGKAIEFCKSQKKAADSAFPSNPIKFAPPNVFMNQEKLKKQVTLADTLISGLQEKKGREILRLDLREIQSAITDYFLICTATSDRHAQALADSALEFSLKYAGQKPNSMEGFQRGEWILIDFIDVVVHIFQAGKREFYNIEELWGDGKMKKFD